MFVVVDKNELKKKMRQNESGRIFLEVERD